jgi:hypothetical protein
MNRQVFVVGAQRCGTSYLYTLLDEHPQIEMAKPLAPEPKYFLRGDFASLNRADYEARYFGKKPGAKRWGEKSTSYMDHDSAAERIASWYGDAQLIFLLRHPAARAVSNYFFSRKNGLENLPMAQAFAEEGRRRDAYDRAMVSTSPFAYLERGNYIKRLRVYERHFERKQMLVLIQEEVIGNVGQVQALYRALGVEEAFIPPSIRKVINSDDVPSERPGAETWDFLERSFAQSIAELEDYLGRGITAWKGQPYLRAAR